jgi:tetratricopeptide (TPR) repeat protein/O-antigen ligase
MSNRLTRFCDGVMEACWLLGLVLTPLFFDIFSSRVFEPDKITLLRSLALAALAAWLIKLIADSGPRFDPARAQFATLKGFLRAPLVIPVLGLLTVYVISTIFSVSPYASLFGSYQRLQGTYTLFSYLVLFAALVANLRKRAQVDRAITIVIVTSLPISLYGIIQHYKLDPLPWGGDTTVRVTGNLGNAIFLAAYLIMAAPVGLGRVVTSFHAILTDPDTKRLPYNIVRAAVYIFVFAVNLVALYFSGSRGPWLGLMAGFFFFFVLLALHWRARTLTLVALGLAALLAVFLVVLNIPNGPLETLRAKPGVGRLGDVFDTQGGTGLVRVLIWQGVVQLVLPHPPIQQPNGAPDTWNAIRPLIGYGPEALYVAYNRFYPPDLGHHEARNASPDRSHNETWDAVANTGLLGLAAYLVLFVAVFYYGLKWLGLITSATRRNVFIALVLVGGAVSAAAFVVLQGKELFGIGLPFGMLIGLIIFLTIYAINELPRLGAAIAGGLPSNSPETWRAIALIGLFSAIVAHFTEIHFGIAIVSTRTHFWIFTGLMLVLGFVLPNITSLSDPALLADTQAAAVASGASAKSRRRARVASPVISSNGERPWHEEWGAVLVGAAMTGAILVTLGFDFIANNDKATQAGQILAESLTQLGTGAAVTHSYAILGLMLITWIAGGALFLLEEPQNARRSSLGGAILASLGISGGVALVAWLTFAGHLASIASFQPTNLNELLSSANAVANTLSIFYIWVGLLVLGMGQALYVAASPPQTGRAAARGRGQTNNSPVAVIAYIALPVAAVVLSIVLNLQNIQSDIIYKTGLQFDDGGQPLAAIPLFKLSLQLAPGEDYYYLFLGRAYLNATNQQSDPTQRDQLLADAEGELEQARKLNPLNTDHTANLARLNRRWSELSTDPAVKAQHAQTSDTYYGQAVLLSPHNAGLWNEWAALGFQVLNNPVAAQQHLDQSFALDKQFDQTYMLQGDLLSTEARAITDTVASKALFNQAIGQYQTGITDSLESDSSNLSTLRINLASAYVGAGQPQNAIAVYQQLLASGANNVAQWQLYLALSQLYAQTGDVGQARSNANLALQALPASDTTDRKTVQDWITKLG